MFANACKTCWTCGKSSGSGIESGSASGVGSGSSGSSSGLPQYVCVSCSNGCPDPTCPTGRSLPTHLCLDVTFGASPVFFTCGPFNNQITTCKFFNNAAGTFFNSTPVSLSAVFELIQDPTACRYQLVMPAAEIDCGAEFPWLFRPVLEFSNDFKTICVGIPGNSSCPGFNDVDPGAAVGVNLSVPFCELGSVQLNQGAPFLTCGGFGDPFGFQIPVQSATLTACAP